MKTLWLKHRFLKPPVPHDVICVSVPISMSHCDDFAKGSLEALVWCEVMIAGGGGCIISQLPRPPDGADKILSLLHLYLHNAHNSTTRAGLPTC